MILQRKSVPVTAQGKEVIGQGGLMNLEANDNDLLQYPADISLRIGIRSLSFLLC